MKKGSNGIDQNGFLNFHVPEEPAATISFQAARALQLAAKQKREQLRRKLLGKPDRPGPPPPAA